MVRPVALAGTLLGHLAQERELRLPRRHRVVGELVAQVVEREREPLAERLGVPQQVLAVGEERRHRLRGLEVALGVLGEQAPGARERALLADAGQHVLERPPRRGRVTHAVRGHRPQAERVGQVQQPLVRGLLLAAAVALHVEVDAARAEGLDDAREPVGVERPASQRLQRLDPGQGEEPLARPVQHLEAQPPLALRNARLHARDQPAQVAVALLRLDEQRQGPASLEAQLGPDDRPHAARSRRLEEARRAREAVAVDERERVVSQLGRPLHQVLGQRRPAQERKGRSGVKLDEHDFRLLFANAAAARPTRQAGVSDASSRGVRS